MSRINSIHEAPVFLASKGHMRVALQHPHTYPIPGPVSGEAPAARRQLRRARLRAEKQEVKRGASFLSLLTTVQRGERLSSTTAQGG